MMRVRGAAEALSNKLDTLEKSDGGTWRRCPRIQYERYDRGRHFESRDGCTLYLRSLVT